MQQSTHLYFYVHGLDTSELIKETVAKWVSKKAGFSAEHIKVGDWRMTRTMGIEGGVVLLLTDTNMGKILRLGSPVAGTTNVMNAELGVDADDINTLMLGPDTDKVFFGGSVAVLGGHSGTLGSPGGGAVSSAKSCVQRESERHTAQ